jgi:uncharacterized protein YjbI with pentapeptide repeats
MATESATRPEDSSKFITGANSEGATFTDVTDFAGKTFTEEANFWSVTFTKKASFEGATFTKGANFRGATFTGVANFKGATFTEGASFEGATFTKGADFRGATFTEGASFEGATFTEGADFRGATFKSHANFVNSEMKSQTQFDGASFRQIPPLFDGTKLHEGTTWFGVTWPPSPRTVEDARLTIRAYERLKLEMDKLKKHEDELKFFVLEMKARRVLEGKWSIPHGMTSGLYGCLCNYGHSYIRPLLLLVAVAVVGAVPFLFHFGLPGWRGSLALSVANTFGLLGFRREFFPPSVISDLPRTLKLISAIQTIAGGVLFFLFGLGLRNRFRMR